MMFCKTKQGIIFKILLEDYNFNDQLFLQYYNINFSNSDIIISLLEKNKDREFELLIHMYCETSDEYFYIYAIQSKYFYRILSNENNNLKKCIKSITINSSNYLSIFSNYELEDILMRVNIYIDLIFKKTLNNIIDILINILSIAVNKFLPNVVKSIIDIVNNNNKIDFDEIYKCILDCINLNTITLVDFIYLYNLLSQNTKNSKYPIISYNIYYYIMYKISSKNIQCIQCIKNELISIFKYILDHNYIDLGEVNMRYIINSIDIPYFMTSDQKILFDMIINTINDQICKGLFKNNLISKNIEAYPIYIIDHFLLGGDWKILSINMYTSSYLYIITKILNIAPDKKIYTDKKIWTYILKTNSCDLVEKIYAITIKYNLNFLLPRILYKFINYNIIDRAIKLGIIKLDGAYNDYSVCQDICSLYNPNVITLMRFNQLGFPLSIRCYEELNKLPNCPHREWGSVCNCSNYINKDIIEYLNKNIHKDLNWQSIKNFMKFKNGLIRFFDQGDNNKLKPVNKLKAVQVFSFNRFSNHISSFYGWGKK